MKVSFTIPAIPVAQPRPRAVTICGRSRLVSNPVKHPVTAFKATARVVASTSYSGAPLAGPLRLRCVFVMPRPTNKRWKTREMLRYPHIARPDCDNLVKSLKDSLTGLVWIDDSQVAELVCLKVVASGDEQPHVEVEITELNGADE